MMYRLISGCLLASQLSGCIGIPIALPEDKPFLAEGELILSPGVSTQQDVLSTLGRALYESDGLWIYSAQRDGLKWGYCIVIPGAGCDASRRWSKTFYLAIDFDVSGTVEKRELMTSRQLCKRRSVCMG